VEPKEGVVNYDLIEKDPIKFYDELFEQPITLTRISRGNPQVQKENNRPQTSLYDTETTIDDKNKLISVKPE
jgi:hypothetical protein